MRDVGFGNEPGIQAHGQCTCIIHGAKADERDESLKRVLIDFLLFLGDCAEQGLSDCGLELKWKPSPSTRMH